MTFENSNITIIRCKDVQTRTGLSRSTIYEMLDKNSPRYDQTFPGRIDLGARSVGWIESEVAAWIQLKISLSRGC